MKLYSRSGTGALLVWQILSQPEEFRLEIQFGQADSNMQFKFVNIDINQSGRGIFEQCELEMNQRISKKKQQGYTEAIPDVGSKITNALGLPKPMLASKYKGQTIDDGPNTVWTQPKLDGNRCIIRISRKHIRLAELYTRNGKYLYNLVHIIADILDNFPKSIYGEDSSKDDIFLDGELYCHGESLQTIVSWVKRKQANTEKIKFMCYDIIKNKTFRHRFNILKQLKHYKFRTIEIVPTTEHNYIDDVIAYSAMMDYRGEGYEGAIIRTNNKPYEDGKRSSSLLKVKHWEDGEFKIIRVETTKDGFGVFVCSIGDMEFKCNPPGDFDFRNLVANNPLVFIGQYVTVEYANLTKDGIPFHPIAKCMVEYKEV